MKALRIHEYGGALQLDEIGQPIAGTGQVLVRNKATSFNPTDPGRASGVMRQVFPLDLPWTPGGDVSGTVEGVGEGVTGFKVGDEVFGYSMAGGCGVTMSTPQAIVGFCAQFVPFSRTGRA